MTRGRTNPLDILTPMEEQPEEVKVAGNVLNETPIPVGEPPEIRGRPVDILESAANIIITQLPSSIRDFVSEIADIVLKIPRWELIAGSVLSQYTQGTLSSPDLDPSWRDPVIAELKRVCEYCHNEFTPHKYGQRFCSNECGGKRSKEELAKKLEAQTERLRERLLLYIQSLKDNVVKQGGKPRQIVLASNVYRQIGPALGGKNELFGLQIKVDNGAPDDRIYIAPA